MSNPLTRDAVAKKRQTEGYREPVLKLNNGPSSPLTAQSVAQKRQREAQEEVTRRYVSGNLLSSLPGRQLADAQGSAMDRAAEMLRNAGRPRVSLTGSAGEMAQRATAQFDTGLNSRDIALRKQENRREQERLDLGRDQALEAMAEAETARSPFAREYESAPANVKDWDQRIRQNQAERAALTVQGRQATARELLSRAAAVGNGGEAAKVADRVLRGEISVKRPLNREIDPYAQKLAQGYMGAVDPTSDYRIQAAQLTDQEANALLYYIGTGDWESANDLAHGLEDTLNQRAGQRKAERINSRTGVGRVLSGLGQSLEAGYEGWGRNIEQFFSKEPIPQRASAYAASGVMQNAEEQGRTVEKYAYLTAQNIGNQLPSVLLSYATAGVMGAAGAGAGAANMATRLVQGGAVGLGAAGDAYGQALESGYDEGKARTYSVLVGASEAALENVLAGVGGAVGIADEQLLAKIGRIDNAIARVALSGAVRVGGEEIEENLQNFLDPLFRTVLFGEEYQAPSAQETIETVIVTALTTGILGGGEIANDIASVRQDAKAGKAYTDGGKELIRNAMLYYDQGSEAYSLAADLAKRESVSALQIGTLQRAMMDEFTASGPKTEAGRDAVLTALEGQVAETAAVTQDQGQEPTEPEPDIPASPMYENAPRAAETANGTARENQRRAERAAASLGENGAKAFRAAYDEATASQIDPAAAFKGFAQAYNAALKGEDVTVENLPAHMAEAARSSGERDRTAAAQARYFQDAGLVKDKAYRKANLTSKQRDSLDTMGKALGVKVQFAEQVADGRANGQYADGIITIALDAQDPVGTVFTHEVVHRIRETAPEAYQALADFVRGNMTAEGLDAAVIRRADKVYRSTDMDAMTEETVADAFGRILGDREAVDRLVRTDRSLGQKLLDVIHDIVQKIRQVLGQGSRAQLTEDQRAEFLDLQNAMEGMERTLREAVEAAGTKNAAREGGEETGRVKYSYAGEKAKTADAEQLKNAKELDEQGADAETIRQRTGWFKGMDGKWRFEVDDSGMEFRRDGDAQLLRELEYRRLQELTQKWADSFEKDGVQLTDREEAEMERLQEEYKDRVWDEKYLLRDFLKHDALFEAYPYLNRVSLAFDDMRAGESGYFDQRSNTIVLSNDLIGTPENTLIHEVQHVIQKVEGFARGASREYWNRRMEEGFSKKTADGIEMMPSDLYRSTAGEIEARDVSARRGLTAEQRKATPPGRGDENTVFAEGGEGAGSVEYSIVEPFTDENGNRYENAVLLDTSFFDGVSPRNWGQKLKQYVESRAENSPLVVVVQDENGNSQTVQFAGKRERAEKNGNAHPVLSELYETSDNISKLGVIHINEIAEISEASNPYYTGESTHGWLDEHGWLHRNANVINARNGAIYNLTFDIAKAADGRTILYATKGKIKRVGNAEVHSLKIRGAEQNSNSGAIVAQHSQDVNGKFSLKEDSRGRELTESQREYFRDSKVVDGDGRLLPVYHATDETFTVFDREKLGSLTDGNATDENWAATSHIGFWFNTEDLSRQAKIGTRAEEVYLNLTDPYQSDSMEALAAQLEQYSGTPKEKGEAFARWLRSEGYDGVVVRDEEFGGVSYIALKPEQVKRITNQTPTGDPDIRYSLKESESGEELGRLNRENEQLRSLIKNWKTMLDKQEKQIGKLKGEMKRTEQISMDREQVAKEARKLAKDYSTEADVSADLESLYNFMLRGGEDFTYTEARARAMGIAEELVNSAVETDRTMYEEYADLRSELRGLRLTVGDNALGQYESVKELRQAMFGKLNVAKGETSNVDDVYQRLNASWPELFPERVINPEDQIERITEVAQQLYTATEYNPYSSDLNSAVRGAANDILERFFDLPQTKKTFADKQAAKLEAARAKGRERTLAAIERERTKRDKALERMRDMYEAREAGAKERLNAADLRNKITRHASALSQKLLKPTDKKHVPEKLRGAVAAVLNSINLESTYSYDPETGSRIAGGEGLPTGRTAAFRELAAQYRTILEGQDGETMVIDPDLAANLDAVAEMKDIPIAKMSTEQLTTLWDALRAVEASVSSEDRLLTRGRFETVSRLADEIKGRTAGLKTKREPDGAGVAARAANAVENLLTVDMLDPTTYFQRLGPGGKAISDALFAAQDKQTSLLAEAARRTGEMVTAEQIGAWEKEKHSFGQLELTTAQVMELYVLSKRQQAQDHIYNGGVKAKGKNTAAVRVNRERVASILSVLTEEQRAVADKMQKYLATDMAAVGNQASMQVYGYAKFGEENYWPIKVDKTSVRSSVQREGAVTSVRNKGMTKATVDKASNALVLGSIFDSYTNHITEMAQYAAFLAPMEDAERVLNYQFRDENGVRTGETIKGELDRIYGGKGSAYFLNLLQDISRGTKGETDTGFTADSLSSAYKASAIGANIRVIVQQPTAAFRAMDVLEPKYWAKGMARGGGWKKAVQWAPIAVWKDWGYFEINTGRSLKDIITGASSRLEKVKQGAMSLAGKADNFTWGRLWNACEEQTAGTTDLARGTNAFYEATARLFNEVVNKTQVVDSVMHRSQMMRSQNAVNRMAASFMSEPTKTYNMFARRIFALADAKTDGERAKAKKALVRTALSVTVSIAANALVQSLIDAMRDSDRDKKYGEKLAERWAENFLDGVNPMTYVPYLKDVVSLLDGFDVSRMDMEAVSKTLQAVQTAYKSIQGKGSQSRANALANLFAQMSRLVGLPVYNLKRDVLAVLNTAAAEADSAWGLWQMDRLLLNPASNAKTFYDDLYRAKGDEKLYGRIYDWMVSKGYTPDGIERAMRDRYKAEKQAGEGYKGDVTSAEDAMAGLYPTEQERSAPAFDMDSLGSEEQKTYYDTWKSVYEDVTNSKSAQNGIARMSDEELTALMRSARTLATEKAKAAAVEDYDGSPEWIGWATGGGSYGVDETEAILFRVAMEMASGDKDENGKTISGSKKQNTLEKAKEIMPWLTQRELDYLMTGY